MATTDHSERASECESSNNLTTIDVYCHCFIHHNGDQIYIVYNYCTTASDPKRIIVTAIKWGSEHLLASIQAMREYLLT